MKIDKKDWEALKPYESDFSRVLDSQYKLPTPYEQDKLILEIVRKYEPKYGPHDFGCPQCSFNLYARAGRLYRSYEPEAPVIPQSEEPSEEETIIQEEVVQEPKPEEKEIKPKNKGRKSNKK